jgi:hypothetical protein
MPALSFNGQALPLETSALRQPIELGGAILRSVGEGHSPPSPRSHGLPELGKRPSISFAPAKSTRLPMPSIQRSNGALGSVRSMASNGETQVNAQGIIIPNLTGLERVVSKEIPWDEKVVASPQPQSRKTKKLL